MGAAQMGKLPLFVGSETRFPFGQTQRILRLGGWHILWASRLCAGDILDYIEPGATFPKV